VEWLGKTGCLALGLAALVGASLALVLTIVWPTWWL
jgi:hypothetical protein